MKSYNYVYITTNLVNGKQYVGSHGSNVLNDRYLGSGILLYHAIKKYGKDNFEKTVLETHTDLKKARFREEFFISKYNTITPNGYNINPNGGIPGTQTPESIEKMRQSLKKVVHNNEWCQKISKSLKGKKKSKEHIENVRKSLIGKQHPLKGQRGYYSKEAIKNFSIAASKRMGILNSMYGKTLYSVWLQKYGENEANNRLQQMKDKMSNTRIGKTFSDTHCKNISKARIGQVYEKIHCPYCGKSTDPGNFKRWHGDKCKMHRNI